MPRHDTLKEPSLPKSREWLTWLSHNLDKLPDDDGFTRLMRDTVIVLHHNIVNCARRLRRNPGWDIQGTMRNDTVLLEEEARANLAHWNANHRRSEAPAKLLHWADMLEGALKQQVRLSREIDELRATGSLEVEVTCDRATGNIIEAKN